MARFIKNEQISNLILNVFRTANEFNISKSNLKKATLEDVVIKIKYDMKRHLEIDSDEADLEIIKMMAKISSYELSNGKDVSKRFMGIYTHV